MDICVLFDLDGTLLDTLADLRDATNYALAAHGYAPRTTREIRRFVGNGAGKLIRRALPETADEAAADAVLATFRRYYDAHCHVLTQPYDGIPQALAALGMPYAIVSNKPDSAVKALCADFFPGVLALGETPDCPRKPAPDMVRRAMDALGASRGIYVGDSEVDVLTARNAGLPCLSVLWGFRDREDMEAVGGTHFCRCPQELPAAIGSLAASLSPQED